MTKLTFFNVFGLIRVEAEHIHVFASGSRPDNQSLDKTISKNLDAPISGMEPGETAVILFAVDVVPGGKTKVVQHNLSARLGGPVVTDQPEILEVLKEIIKHFSALQN